MQEAMIRDLDAELRSALDEKVEKRYHYGSCMPVSGRIECKYGVSIFIIVAR